MRAFILQTREMLDEIRGLDDIPGVNEKGLVLVESTIQGWRLMLHRQSALVTDRASKNLEIGKRDVKIYELSKRLFWIRGEIRTS